MIAEMLVQMSLLAFYIRVFPGASVFVRRASWGLMGVVACFGVANTCSMIFQCNPIPFFWKGWTGEVKGRCIDINLFSWIRAAIEIAIDVAILSLPLPSVIKLQMNWKKKFQVLIMFALGFVYVDHLPYLSYLVSTSNRFIASLLLVFCDCNLSSSFPKHQTRPVSIPINASLVNVC
jgi:hypothetical protein